MTDRIRVLSVCLDKEYRDDDCEAIINAIKMVRGVSDVEAHVEEPRDWANRARIRRELGQKLWSVLYPEDKTQ